MKILTALALCLLSISIRAAEKTNYEAAVAYVQSLMDAYDIQQTSAADLKTAQSPTEQILLSIKASTRNQIELRTTIAGLKQLDVTDDAKPFVDGLISFYSQESDIHGSMIAISEKLMEGPKPGVNLSELTSDFFKLSAMKESIDQSVFKLSPAFFAIMIDKRPDKQGHVSHLLISCQQRRDLLSRIQQHFGAALDAKSQNWTVSGATVMRSYLRKDWKCAEEPW